MIYKFLFSVKLCVTSYLLATDEIIELAKQHQSSFICLANVHMLMEAFDSPEYKNILNSADLITPDGIPLVWMMRIKGAKNQQRVYGPTLMLHVLEAASRENIPVGFYGSKPEVLSLLIEKLQSRFQKLNVVYSFSPPFEEDTTLKEQSINEIKNSGARILFVGLGCPKQEIWMAKHRDKLNVVMLGVGAAFDFHAGTKPQAPPWMQKIGLEWFFRFLTEPRRLWRRYLYHNPRFIYFSIKDLLQYWLYNKNK